jgi:hypothetical protein
MKALVLFFSVALFSASSNAESIFLFGAEKSRIFTTQNIELDCIHDIGIMSVPAEMANLSMPFDLATGREVEMAFNGCNDKAELMSISYSISDEKYDSLFLQYLRLYGMPIEDDRRSRSEWILGDLRVSFSKSPKGGYFFYIGSEKHRHNKAKQAGTR